jgi:hypothetical protein
MNMLRIFSHLGIFLFTFGLYPNGQCQVTNAAPSHPRSLIVLPSASKVTFRSVDGATQLTYTINAAYPAQDELRAISDNLVRQGWKPLKYDFLNPSIPSSHVRGWQHFDDHTTHPYTSVKQWLAWWMNTRHEVVSYALEYRYPVKGDVDLHTVRVFANFMPAQIAETKQAISK